MSAEKNGDGLPEAVEALAVSLDRGDSIDRGIASDLRALLAEHPAMPAEVRKSMPPIDISRNVVAMEDVCPPEPDAGDATRTDSNAERSSSGEPDAGDVGGLSQSERDRFRHWLHGGIAGGIVSLWAMVEQVVADRERKAAERALRDAAEAINLSGWYDPSPLGGVTSECANAEVIAARYIRACADIEAGR